MASSPKHITLQIMVNRPNPEKPPKGMGVEECMRRAEEFIGQNGACLFLMDIAGSRHHPDQAKLFEDYERLLAELNAEFDEYLPVNDLAIPSQSTKGFDILIGDGAGGGINSSEVIPQIIGFADDNYPDLALRYGVAADGFDQEGVRLIK